MSHARARAPRSLLGYFHRVYLPAELPAGRFGESYLRAIARLQLFAGKKVLLAELDVTMLEAWTACEATAGPARARQLRSALNAVWRHAASRGLAPRYVPCGARLRFQEGGGR